MDTDLALLFYHNTEQHVGIPSPGHTRGETYDLIQDRGQIAIEVIDAEYFTLIAWNGRNFVVVDEAHDLQQAFLKAIGLSDIRPK